MSGNHLTKKITPKQLEVLVALVSGKTNKEIGTELNLSEKTVKNHLCSLYHHLNVRTRTQAFSAAVTSGLIEMKDGVWRIIAA